VAKRGRPKDGPERESRRQDLLEAAIRVIHRDGADVSMDDIATEAGITKPILYSHFGDKAGLADALADHLSTSIGDVVEAARVEVSDVRGSITAMIDAYVQIVEAEPNLYWFLVSGFVTQTQPGVRKLINDMGALVSRVLGEQLRAAGVDSGGAEPWAFGIIGMVDMATAWWLQRQSMSRADLVDYLTSLLWTGLAGHGLGSPEGGST
jgi:AcrR family transcriptional regulator